MRRKHQPGCPCCGTCATITVHVRRCGTARNVSGATYSITFGGIEVATGSLPMVGGVAVPVSSAGIYTVTGSAPGATTTSGTVNVVCGIDTSKVITLPRYQATLVVGVNKFSYPNGADQPPLIERNSLVTTMDNTGCVWRTEPPDAINGPNFGIRATYLEYGEWLIETYGRTFGADTSTKYRAVVVGGEPPSISLNFADFTLVSSGTSISLEAHCPVTITL